MRVLHWFRSDLRLVDNTALAAAAARADQVVPAFVFDDTLLESDLQGAPRVRFMLDCVERLARECAERGNPLILRRGSPAVEIPKLAREAEVQRVTWNRDYTPYAKARDASVEQALTRADIAVETFKDRVIFEAREVLSQQDRPFAVYTPYKKAWWRKLEAEPLEDLSPLRLGDGVSGLDRGKLPSASDLGVGGDAADIPTGGEAAAVRRLRAFLERDVVDYQTARDFPAREGTSRISPYLRFGVVSIRKCFREAQAFVEENARASKAVHKWLDELIWREFYNAILDEHPRVMHGAYREEYDALPWDDDPALLEAWQKGETGYPFIDAGMREMAATGWMHNRARMAVASFLTKDLLIDWRKGERWFMQKLVDGDPANNNGGWQWSASTGTDAQPYFRIFNPTSQGERFDPEGAYVKRWVPELEGLKGKQVHRPWDAPLEAPGYPAPVVDHKERREMALERYKAVRESASQD